jgi:hypothetical protein
MALRVSKHKQALVKAGKRVDAKKEIRLAERTPVLYFKNVWSVPIDVPDADEVEGWDADELAAASEQEASPKKSPKLTHLSANPTSPHKPSRSPAKLPPSPLSSPLGRPPTTFLRPRAHAIDVEELPSRSFLLRQLEEQRQLPDGRRYRAEQAESRAKRAELCACTRARGGR